MSTRSITMIINELNNKIHWPMDKFKKKDADLIITHIVFGIVCILLFQATIVGSDIPFGIIFYIASYGMLIDIRFSTCIVVLGVLTHSGMPDAILHLTIILVFHVMMTLLKYGEKEKKTYICISGSVGVLLPNFIETIVQGALVYDFFQSLFKTLVVTILIFVFRMGWESIYKLTNGKALKEEEWILLSVAILIMITPLVNFQPLGFSFGNMTCNVFLLLSCYTWGIGAGSSIGAAAGLIYYITFGGIMPLGIALLGISGLLGGMMKSFGKIGTVLGFIGGYAVFGLCIGMGSDVLLYMKEMILSALFFMMIPNRMMVKMNSYIYFKQK